MIRAALALILTLCLAQPAFAHKLKVFATVEGDAVTGYAFFIGGGRARGAKWTATGPGGAVLADGHTGADGAFWLVSPGLAPTDLTITVDTEEGHIARAVLAGAAVRAASEIASAVPDPDATAALVEAAVQRQITPLLIRIAEMDARLRLVDVLSGLFLIIGLAGMALWARGGRGRR